MAHEFHTSPRARNNFGNMRVYRRVRFRSSGPVGYGPTMWVRSRKGGDVLRDHASKACQGGSLSIMSATTSIPRARDEENYFPAR